ncbi:unnamed protein product [Symbiodinium natans]|uniref:Pentatricopeptide repeat-containing protein, chloroplastic n=1 Tax=Symbiodinium natans TaxID=878477 RepID=A0A812T8X2_9DINO|nr:unnamed protein product [Symbiodinium natans]
MPALAWTQDWRNVEPAVRKCHSAESSAQALMGLARGSQATGAIAFLRTLRLQDIRLDTTHYRAVALASYLAQSWEVALELVEDALDTMGGSGLQIDFWDRAISSCRNAGRWQVASYFLMRMRERGVQGDEICFANAMSACLKGLEWRASMGLFERMHVDGVQPDLVCKGTALAACKQVRLWDQALGLLSTVGVTSRLFANDVCFNAALASLASSDKWEAGAGLLATLHLQLVRPDAVTYGALLPAFERRRAWDEAGALLVAAPCAGASAFNAVASVCEKAGAWLKALQICSAWMPARRLTSDLITFNAATSACEKVAVWELAMDLFTSLPGNALRRDVFSYAACTSACGNGSKWRLALELLWSDARELLDTSVVSCSAALTACAEGRKWPMALHLLWESTMPLDTVAWNSAIAACASSYQWQQAVQLLANLFRAAVLPNVLTYQFVLDACEHALQPGNVSRLLESTPIWLVS